jgi:hypothetical protein
MSDEADNTGEIGPRDDKGRFGPGNPGKPKGSRHALGEAFVKALHDDFVEHGEAVIQAVRTEKPDQYMKVVASLLPKEFKIETTSDLTDEQLDARIRTLANLVEVGIAEPARGAEASEGSATAH